MKNLQKGFIVPLLLEIIVLLVIGGGVYVYKNKKAEVPAVVDTGTQQTNNKTQPSQNVNLEKYQDTESGFQFNFPNNWKIVQDKAGLQGNPGGSTSYIQSPDYQSILHDEGEVSFKEIKQGAEIFIYVQVSPSAKTIKDLQEFNKLGTDGPAYVNERVVKVDGREALLYDYTNYGGSLGHHLELLNNNRWIRINIGYKGLDGKKVFDNIISTFDLYK